MKVLLLGASGLVGGELLKQLINDPKITEILLFSRKSLTPSLKVREFTGDLLELFEKEKVSVDLSFCCLGSTMKKAGSKDAFKSVDYGIVTAWGKYCEAQKIPRVGVISAHGANPLSVFFYNKVKGEMEEFIQRLDFERLVIARPSLILGKRKESRLIEGVFRNFFELLPGCRLPIIKNVWPVKASKIAEVLYLKVVKGEGREVLPSEIFL